ncbi:glycosyl transferase family protein [Pontixanthobacter aestiaquae]|uniref:glycosyl transferase family protein n=1 Tax=Pontixanthobacter aestiaquae TaxID=1509367 RepID=UPI001F1BC8C7|nr:glycosyl transferase family protein [Pontixanthobacter aestiaquae]MDN3646121.1 glycosyl transferase family protein [Pontixanthobacter aestiaquae]
MLEYSAWEWLVLVQHELLLFAGVFFLIGAIDEMGIDFAWLWLRLTRQISTPRLSEHADLTPELNGIAAVFIPAWQESAVVGTTIAHALSVWSQSRLRIYVGCYRNDPQTMEAVTSVAGGDPRVRLVIHDEDGPSTKADCLNRLYDALCDDEARSGDNAQMVILHDAEDMVDPAALMIIDQAMDEAELVQLPVLPIAVARSRWISGHYQEEFAEAHGKAMVVRDALRAGMPLAGVGCAIARGMLEQLAETKPSGQPFASECLTEDYELGIGAAELGARARFIRIRHHDGRLVATRACFPAKLDQAVRQKTRWVHGIAFQGWDTLGWSARPVELWMRLRDRRGPLLALVLAAAYLLLVLSTIGWLLSELGYGTTLALSPALKIILLCNLGSFLWRAIWRFAFTAREYDWREGARAVLRIPVANIIAIMAGRRAFSAYLGTLAGQLPRWDKTEHSAHPAMMHQKSKPV